MLYLLLVGFPPFQGKCENDIFHNVSCAQPDYTGKEWSRVSELAKDLVQ